MNLTISTRYSPGDSVAFTEPTNPSCPETAKISAIDIRVIHTKTVVLYSIRGYAGRAIRGMFFESELYPDLTTLTNTLNRRK